MWFAWTDSVKSASSAGIVSLVLRALTGWEDVLFADNPLQLRITYREQRAEVIPLVVVTSAVGVVRMSAERAARWMGVLAMQDDGSDVKHAPTPTASRALPFVECVLSNRMYARIVRGRLKRIDIVW